MKYLLSLIIIGLVLCTGCTQREIETSESSVSYTLVPQSNSESESSSQRDSSQEESSEDAENSSSTSETESVDASESKTETSTHTANDVSISTDSSVDIDLTSMSSTMVFAEVYDIMWAPDLYEGKTIKMRGNYAAFYNEPTDEYYHAVLITDALACCSQGIEFIWNGEHSYPEDYPSEDTEIEVTGTFHVVDGDQYFCYIETDDINIV